MDEGDGRFRVSVHTCIDGKNGKLLKTNCSNWKTIAQVHDVDYHHE